MTVNYLMVSSDDVNYLGDGGHVASSDDYLPHGF